MVARPDLRAGDTDREAAAASLREHYAQGRLSLEEFNERLDSAFAAVTQRDLDALTSDLPHVRTPVAPLPVSAGQGAAGSGGRGAGGHHGSGGRGGAGGSRRGGVRASLRVAFALVMAVAVGLIAMVPTWHSFFGLPGRWSVLAIGLVIFRFLFRRIFGGRRPGGFPGRFPRGGRYTGYGRSGPPW